MCERCTDGRPERLHDPSDQTIQQRQRGCHGPAIAPFGFEGADLPRCPVRLVDWGAVEPVLDVWPHLTAGRYPMAGGYADQPALYIDLLAVADRLAREDQEK